MSYHSQYLEIFNRSQAFILRGDGPLPFHYRHYIAIMVIVECAVTVTQWPHI